MTALLESLVRFWQSTGIYRLINSLDAAAWQTVVMLAIVVVLVYLAIVKKFEPLLLLPIAIGMLLTNLPGGELFHSEYWFCDITELNSILEQMKEAYYAGDVLRYNALYETMTQYDAWFDFAFNEAGQITDAYINYANIFQHGGLLDLLYIGVKTGIYPCLIFIGIGAMTDFSPLISNPKSFLIGAGAQLGVFVAFAGALLSGCSQAGKPRRSVSSAARTVRRRSPSPRPSRPRSWEPSPSRRTPIWR